MLHKIQLTIIILYRSPCTYIGIKDPLDAPPFKRKECQNQTTIVVIANFVYCLFSRKSFPSARCCYYDQTERRSDTAGSPTYARRDVVRDEL